MQLAATTRHRRDLCRILSAALSAADAGRAVERSLVRDGDVLLVDGVPLPRGPEGRLLLVGAGKASVTMADVAARIAGRLLTQGVVVSGVPGGAAVAGVEILAGGHPLPDDRSLVAGARILEQAQSAREGDVVLFLLSGGASAMIEQLAEGVSLDELRARTNSLLRSGAPIEELNAMRKKLSLIKAGGVARAAAPAFVQTLAVSDVVGDAAAVIGSGPTVDGDAGVDGGYRVIANIDDALAGAAECARRAGYETEILSNSVIGEACAAGEAWGRAACAKAEAAAPVCLLAGGETTVRVRGKGRGGRNQEFALAASTVLEGQSDVTVAAIGTDGQDGPTDAAGAVADGETVARGRLAGNDPAGFLADNDSYTFFAELGDLVTTGPTRTNVMDLHIALAGNPDD